MPWPLILSILCLSCVNGPTRNGGANSEPINPKEDKIQKQSLIRCYKTGGSRIVKIDGVLRCF